MNISTAPILLGLLLAQVSWAQADWSCEMVGDNALVVRDLGDERFMRCIDSLQSDEVVDVLRQLVAAGDELTSIRIVKMLEEGTDLANVPHLAANTNMVDLLKETIVLFPITIDSKDQNGREPIVHAAFNGSLDATILLLSEGATKGIGSALAVAIRLDFEKVVNELLSADSSWTGDPEESVSVIVAALQYSSVETVTAILELGVSPDLRDEAGFGVITYTPHHRDSETGRVLWELLKSRGAESKSSICKLDTVTIEHIREQGPDWFVKNVNEDLNVCRQE